MCVGVCVGVCACMYQCINETNKTKCYSDLGGFTEITVHVMGIR